MEDLSIGLLYPFQFDLFTQAVLLQSVLELNRNMYCYYIWVQSVGFETVRVWHHPKVASTRLVSSHTGSSVRLDHGLY